MSSNTLPTEAQSYFDEANEIFPGRYELGTFKGKPAAFDTTKKHDLVVSHADPVKMARELLTRARLSANNGNRRYEPGEAPESATVRLPVDKHREWTAEAQALRISLSELLLRKLLGTHPL